MIAGWSDLARALLFQLPPETAHACASRLLDLYAACGAGVQPLVPGAASVSLMGISFPSRLGLAAGFDKNGDHIAGLSSLGFGFLELGTVTPHAQNGQPKPRIFRLLEDKALINRMGFPNKGVDHLIEQLRAYKKRPILGINIGKNAATELENAHQDYLYCMQKVYPWADYIAINISSPNTAGLRLLQRYEFLVKLLDCLIQERASLAMQHGCHVPLLLKIAPDMDADDLDSLLETCLKFPLEGLIISNTTLSREALQSPAHLKSEAGGLSGAPLMARSTQCLATVRAKVGSRFVLVGVGGILSPEDALAKRDAGADLLQMYTGLIYQGPRLITQIRQILGER